MGGRRRTCLYKCKVLTSVKLVCFALHCWKEVKWCVINLLFLCLNSIWTGCVKFTLNLLAWKVSGSSQSQWSLMWVACIKWLKHRLHSETELWQLYLLLDSVSIEHWWVLSNLYIAGHSIQMKRWISSQVNWYGYMVCSDGKLVHICSHLHFESYCLCSTCVVMDNVK